MKPFVKEHNINILLSPTHIGRRVRARLQYIYRYIYGYLAIYSFISNVDMKEMWFFIYVLTMMKLEKIINCKNKQTLHNIYEIYCVWGERVWIFFYFWTLNRFIYGFKRNILIVNNLLNVFFGIF